ncbi:MAG TPA: nuclear transport factor 2 family protein [Pseudomonadales bacterium]|nr:nuclear transport factor 2 family protein [Pseudomonadales bacterium]
MNRLKLMLTAILLMFGAVIARADPAARDAGALALDRLEVIELSSRYAWGIDTLDRALLARTFTPDAVAEYVGVGEKPLDLHERLEGFEKIYAWLTKSLGHRKGWQALPWHFVENHLVELHGDIATMKYYMHNRPMAAGGIYTVQAVRTPEGWRIAHLKLEEQIWKTDFYQPTPATDRP